MDFLKAEIERKKKQIQDKQIMPEDKKYFKRGDLAAKQEEEYWKKHKRLKTDESDEGSASEGPSTSDTDTKKTEDTEKHILPRKEVIRRLRERDEPILLFAETEMEAFQRLKKLEMMEPEVNRGFKNDFKAAMDKVDQQYLEEIIESAGDSHDRKSNNVKVVDDGSTHDSILQMAENLGKGDEDLDSEVVLRFLKLILRLWGEQLNSRPEEEKQMYRGKMESATHSQTVSYLRPLFRKLKKRELPSDLLSCMADIIRQLLDKDYLKANDAYLEMAIGNAPWPIGVTMVGIHARTGREKIFARNVAHVLNDESQRKYIQGLKRLMTRCQKLFPTDPSKSVDFEGEIH